MEHNLLVSDRFAGRLVIVTLDLFIYDYSTPVHNRTSKSGVSNNILVFCVGVSYFALS